jgi:pyrroline-5-carboxylate reductase
MNVGLLGAGHIARALAEGWSRAEAGPGRPDELTFFDVVPDRAAALAADTGGVAADDPAALVAASDLVILAVRPPQVDEALGEVATLLGGRALVSVAAGMRLARLEGLVPPNVPLGRMMPNVAAALGLGVFLYVPGTLGPATGPVRELFASAGVVVEVAEDDYDVGTAIASCLPGFVARFAEAFTAAGVAGGLDRETAAAISLGGLHGAGAVVAAAGDPAAVVTAAATPGGMTAAGIAALEAHDIDAAVAAAVKAAAATAAHPA